MGLPLATVTHGSIQPEDSGVAFEQKNESLNVCACLGVDSLDISRTSYWVSEGKH